MLHSRLSYDWAELRSHWHVKISSAGLRILSKFTRPFHFWRWDLGTRLLFTCTCTCNWNTHATWDITIPQYRSVKLAVQMSNCKLSLTFIWALTWCLSGGRDNRSDGYYTSNSSIWFSGQSELNCMYQKELKLHVEPYVFATDILTATK